MRLGLNLSYWGMGNDANNLLLAKEADKLGFAVVWAAEAYGSDVVSVLSYVAAQTEKIDVGSAIMQIPARTPAMTAMTAATLDTLSGGRFRLGLGVSGPQVSEGWHGVKFDFPLGRTREYIDIVRMALARERVKYDGKHYQLPLPDGQGKPIKLTVHPVREKIPIYLASVGPKNIELTGEVADGWLGLFVTTESLGDSLELIKTGRAKVGKDLSGFDVAPSMGLAIGDDLEEMANRLRPNHALYVGGMGSRKNNFYNQIAVRLGYEKEAAEIQNLYLAREYDKAAAAVPLEFVDRTTLIGPEDRIAERLTALKESGVTTVNIMPAAPDLDSQLGFLRQLVSAAEKAGI